MTYIVVRLFFSLETPGLLCYKMNCRPRGMCVIINNLNGAEFDERELEDPFNELSFEVSIRKDLEGDEMPKVAAEFAAKDHSQFDAFVFVLMSHGGERDVIYGVDGRKTTVEELMSVFKASNCPTLRDKPKLFFIQTYRGTKDENISATTGNSDSCMDAFSTDSTFPGSACPIEADFLLAYSASPCYRSWFVKVSLNVFFFLIKYIPLTVLGISIEHYYYALITFVIYVEDKIFKNSISML